MTAMTSDSGKCLPRRSFLKLSVAGAGAFATGGASTANAADKSGLIGQPLPINKSFEFGKHTYAGPYTGSFLDRVAFPMGGMGAGMICLEGTGALSHFSLRPESLASRREKQIRVNFCLT